MSGRTASERGSAMVLAIMVTLMMLALVLGTFALVEGQQRASADERIRDSAYNLTDSAVDSAVTYMTLTEDFPSYEQHEIDGKGYGDANGVCGPSPAAGLNCPDPQMVLSAFSAASGHKDYGAAPQWTTSVRDNNQPTTSYYTEDPNLPAPQRTGYKSSNGEVLNYDFNNDDKVWVRAEGYAQGRKRVLVALVEQRVLSGPPPYPQTGIFAEDVTVPTGGGFFIDMQGDSPVPGRLDLGCNNPGTPSQGGSLCPQASAPLGNILPWTVSTTQDTNLCIDELGNQFSNPIAGPFCWEENTGAKIQELRQRAQDAGSYYNGVCPSSLEGDIIFIDFDNEMGRCNYSTGSATWNSPEDPGLVVLGRYPVENCSTAPGVCFNIAGDNTYHGMIYMGNTWNPQGTWGIGIQGNAKMYGVIIAEFWQKVAIGSTQRPSFVYDPNAWQDYGNAPSGATSSTETKIVPGTFHELPAH